MRRLGGRWWWVGWVEEFMDEETESVGVVGGGIHPVWSDDEGEAKTDELRSRSAPRRVQRCETG